MLIYALTKSGEISNAVNFLLDSIKDVNLPTASFRMSSEVMDELDVAVKVSEDESLLESYRLCLDSLQYYEKIEDISLKALTLEPIKPYRKAPSKEGKKLFDNRY